LKHKIKVIAYLDEPQQQRQGEEKWNCWSWLCLRHDWGKKRRGKSNRTIKQFKNLHKKFFLLFYWFFIAVCVVKMHIISIHPFQCHIPLLLYIAMRRKTELRKKKKEKCNFFICDCTAMKRWIATFFLSSWRLPGKWDAADTAFCIWFIAPSWMFIILILFISFLL